MATGLATGGATVYVQADHPAPRCPMAYYSPQQPINVCPTATSISSRTAESLQEKFPTYKTGIGSYVAVQVSPTTPSGVIVTETLSKGASTCPAGFPNVCTTSTGGTTSSLSIGTAATTLDGTNLAATPNIMWDEHAVASSSSLLASGQSCSATCNQQYSCGGTVIGQYTITYSFTTSTISGTLVTNVAAGVQ